MNKVILKGNMTKDPILQSTQSGLSILRFNIALNRGKDKDGNDKGADFPTVIAFGKSAETISKYFCKGKEILVEGRIRTDKYDKDGKTVYTTDVILERFEFVGNKNNGQTAKNQNTSNLATNNGNNVDNLGDEDFHLLADDDDVPF